MSHSLSKLSGQFVLGKNGIPTPEGWSYERIGMWHLARHSSLPGIRLVDDDGRLVGWLLGFPIDGNGLLLSEGDARVVPGLQDPEGATLEEFVYGFGGRFLVVLVDIPQPRIYLDPAGSLSAVFCPHQEIIASTPNLIPYDEHSHKQVDLANALGIPNSNAMYPFELTPRHNIFRLLPNHYLSLSEWKSIRHWPKTPLHSEGSVEEAIEAITNITKRQIAAIVSRIPTYLRLTGGQDSRMLLACAKEMIDRIELLTFPIQDEKGLIDVHIAKKIGRRFHLRHFLPEVQPAKQEDLDAFMFRIDFGTGEVRGWKAATIFNQANPVYAQLDGGVGGLDRIGEDLYPRETISTKITPERLLTSCQAPRSEVTLSTVQRWLENAPAVNAFQILDLVAIEQRLGCWGGNTLYAESPDPGFVLFPLCHREVIERMITLPVNYRLSANLMRDIIAREWPELLVWPFSKPVGLLRALFAGRLVQQQVVFQATRFERVIRKLGRVGNRI